MIPAELYETVYLLLISIFTVIGIQTKRTPLKKESPIPSAMLCTFLVFFIGLRPFSFVFVDMMNYAMWWDREQWISFDVHTENLLFDNLYCFMAGNNMPVELFFILIAAIYFTGMLVACLKLFPNHALLAFLVCLAAFSTFSYGTNGIKAGAAASLFLVALAYRDNIIISIAFILLSWGFHHSMQLPVGAYIVSLFMKKKECFFYGWLFCLVMAIFHVSFFQNLFAGFSDESGAGYLTSTGQDWGGKTGFRIDFVIYSAMPVIMGYYAKYKYKFSDKLYDNILNIYLTCNGFWMLCMYASFTNRIAYLSWFIYPLVLIYPCFSICNRKHPLVANRNRIVLAHLSFTLFMALIYY